MNHDMNCREALQLLVLRLKAIHADPTYQSVWTINQAHVGPYKGPTYTAELEGAKKALELAPRSERPFCIWTPDDDGVFQTGCGQAFCFIDAGPKENHMKFCCYCGDTLQESSERNER